MAFPIPDGYVECQVGIESTINTHVSSISWITPVVSLTLEFLQIRDTVAAALPDIFQDICEDFTATTLRLTENGDDPGSTVSVEVGFGVPIAGGNGTECMAPQAALVLRKFTGVLGRHGRGRFFLPGVNETDITPGGAIDPTKIDDYNNHAATFLEKLADPGGVLTAYPMALNSHIAGSAIAADVVGVAYATHVGWVRRRLAA